MTVATMDYWPDDGEPRGFSFREDLRKVSNALHELSDDENYDLPSWFRSACERTSVYILDPLVDLSFGHLPATWKGSCLMLFVDRWHQEYEFKPAPYSWNALTRRLRSKLGNGNSIMLRQK